MKINAVLHVAIAVKDVDQALEMYQRFLGAPDDVEIIVFDKAKTREAHFALGGVRFQLCQSMVPDGRFTEYLRDHGGKEGLHHICFLVDDIHESLAESVRKGATLAPCRACHVAGPHKHSGGWVAFLKDHITDIEVEFLQRYKPGEGPDAAPAQV
jgi:methylmalonyl-CoA/ethylmalonyl-CoA epimerase